ncbi:hypothetical protein QA646_17865 [Rhizobium sp. CB3090]|uniref:hypothetical protein n=1 Tax=Rhizobium sp. CB3090 TaxID=3039156 RepID=UPI0024B0C7D7|nr:hypothetical protein [Rhizobium sp. CB3090]WFU09113.1 hypothetical protein QA646_17865 [Rhizobium sp. CB3090]
MPNHAVTAAGEAMPVGNTLSRLAELLRAGDSRGALALIESSTAMPPVSRSTETTTAATNRRNFLLAKGGLLAASAASLVVDTPKAAFAASEAPRAAEDISGQVETINENPDLLKAYDTLLAAQAEESAAKEAFEWLGDEWKHAWPLAPDELLGSANAHQSGRQYIKYAERDILGRFMMRDTSGLAMKVSPEFREKYPRTCFHVYASEEAKERIAYLSQRTPKGRTEKSLARDRAWIEGEIVAWKQRLELALKYEAETTRLSEAAGVVPAAQRVCDADAAVKEASAKISMIPAFTHLGLQIKARAVQASGLFDGDPNTAGRWGEFCRFIHAVIDMGGEVRV